MAATGYQQRRNPLRSLFSRVATLAGLAAGNVPVAAAGVTTVGGSTAETLLAGEIELTDYCTVLDGSATQSTQLAAAIAAAEASGKLLHIKPGVTLRLDTPVTCGAGSLHLRLDGRLLTPLDQTGFTSGMLHWAPATSALQTVSAISAVEYPASSGHYVSRLTVSSLTGWAQNAVAFLACSDLAHATDTDLAFRMAEILPVVAVDVAGPYIYLSRVVSDPYTTGVTVRRLSDYRLEITGSGSLEGISDAWAAGTDLNGGVGALVIEGAVGAKVNIAFRNLLFNGLRAVSCYDSDFTVRAKNLRNNSAAPPLYLGYGAAAVCATRNCRFDVKAKNVRHAFTNITYTRPGYPLWDAGGARECVVTGRAVDCTGISWDLHPGAYDMVFNNISIFGMVRDSQSDAGTTFAFQDRGCNTIINGMHVVGNAVGLFYVIGIKNKYGRHNIPRYSNIYATNTDRARSAPIVTTTFASVESNIIKQIIIENLSTLYYSQSAIASSGPKVFIRNFTYLYPGANRWGSGVSTSSAAVEVVIDGCYMVTDGASEPFTINYGNILYLSNLRHYGAIGTSTLVRVNGSVGSATYRWNNNLSYTAGLTHYGVTGGGATLDAAAVTLLS